MDPDFGAFVLAATTADPETEPMAREHADAVEFRMDLARDPLGALESYRGELPLIATNRTEREGGGAPENANRLRTLRTAAEHPAVVAVDIELATVLDGESGRDVLEHAHEHDARTIVSAHDFKSTPMGRLSELLVRACTHGDVGKLAVTAQDPDDVLALLSATREVAASGERVATMAMGEAGRHSRVVAPIYGSCIGYAPIDPTRATAPGQYALETMAGLIEQLR